MRAFETVFISILISNIVKIYASKTIWVTGITKYYDPMNIGFHIRGTDFDIKVVVVDVNEKRFIKIKDDDFKMGTRFHFNIEKVPDDFQTSKVYNVSFLYYSGKECNAIATKIVPDNCHLTRVLNSDVYKCELKDVDPNKLEHRWKNFLDRLKERTIKSHDVWSQGDGFWDIPFYNQ